MNAIVFILKTCISFIIVHVSGFAFGPYFLEKPSFLIKGLLALKSAYFQQFLQKVSE